MEVISVLVLLVLLLTAIGGRPTSCVMIERTKRLSMSNETPPEVHERLARIEARLSDIEARQHQLQATQEWQQKLLEHSN